MPKTVLITGGSRGIGAACAKRLAADGWDVAISYRARADEAEAVVQAVEAAGRKAISHQADVADPAQIEALFQAVDAAFGRLDALVNNAGVTSPPGPLADCSTEELKRSFDVNVLGAFVAAREAVRRMATGRGGSGGVICNLSSVAARLGSPGEYIQYAAGKGAIDVMTEALAKEVGPEGVRVVGVAPGVIETEIHASQGQDEKPARVAQSTPLRRNGRAEEVADAVAWLLSDAAGFVTGTTVGVTGGR